MKKIFNYKLPIYIFFVLFSLCFILPLILVVSASFSTAEDISTYGFSMIPKNFTVIAYDFLFANFADVGNAYLVTIAYALIGSLVSVLVMSMTGYAISSDAFAFKKPMKIFLLITMFFSGGIVPSYILNTQVYHLNDTFWIYIVSGMVSAYTIFVFKAFFQQLPKEIFESVRLDGANEWNILTSIVMPLSKPVIATYTVIGILNRWNDYSTNLYYISDKKLYTVQFLLQSILTEADQLKALSQNLPYGYTIEDLPSESLKFAICVISTVPMLIVFPLFQKFFSKGMVVGSVKG